MGCGVTDLISFFLYKICKQRNDPDSDWIRRTFERIEELQNQEDEEDERLRAVIAEERQKRLSLLQKHRAEIKRLRTPLKNNGEEKTANEEIYLPSDVLLDILSRLAFKDNIRSSAVCKTWGEIAASVRVRDPSCWLMYLDPYHTKGVAYGFLDPIEKKKTKAMNLPEFSESCNIVCSNDGWLLMSEFVFYEILFFFNPFTRERIYLPEIRFGLFEIRNSSIKFAFSCAPTKKGCLVFGIKQIRDTGRSVRIFTWHHGATTWVNEEFPCLFTVWCTSNVLHSDGLFYRASDSALGVFDPSARTWNELAVQPIRRLIHIPIWWITKYKGEIFLVDASFMEPMVFRLNRLESVWEEKETLDGWSFFLSSGSCVMHSGSVSNILHFWNIVIGGGTTEYQRSFCVRPYNFNYSLYSNSFCEEPEGYYIVHEGVNSKNGVWIQPPHNISIYDFPIIDHSDF